MSREQRMADEHRQSQKKSQHFAERARQRGTEMRDRQTNRESSLVRASLSFLNAEVDTGLTLGRVAKSRSGVEERSRQIREARKAYDSVIKYLGTAAQASTEELQALQDRMAGLRELLESLGEKF
jgi:uncharacterized protein YPO0396